MNLIKRKFSLSDYCRYDIENREVLLFERSDCNILLEEFYGRVLEAIKLKRHFPIIRIADGEYQFLLGKNEFNLRKPFIFLIKNLLGEILRKIIDKDFEAKSRTYTSGVYDTSEHSTVQKQYSQCLKHVSDNGILALYTIIKPNFYTEQYLPKLWDFFGKQNISLSNDNYIPFYFVYILLTNKKYSDIYLNKRIHLITSYDNNRKKNIEKSLFSFGVRQVTWTKISKDKSLFDTLNIDMIPDDIDIIFVGAGVGKVNIFNQLHDIKVPIIDAGYIFETWQEPSMVNERDYCFSHV